uniref:Uncharacterized protein n=1 Tax=Lepeophtheirus salmonis TaxID=72036 RepID=A0A0K2U5W2_LEPSM
MSSPNIISSFINQFYY